MPWARAPRLRGDHVTPVTRTEVDDVILRRHLAMSKKLANMTAGLGHPNHILPGCPTLGKYSSFRCSGVCRDRRISETKDKTTIDRGKRCKTKLLPVRCKRLIRSRAKTVRADDSFADPRRFPAAAFDSVADDSATVFRPACVKVI